MHTIIANDTLNNTVISLFNPLPPDSDIFLVSPETAWIVSYPEQVAISGTISWLAINQAQLNTRYGERWLLIEDQVVLGDADDPADLERMAEERHIHNPLITKVPPPSAHWRTAYVVCQ